MQSWKLLTTGAALALGLGAAVTNANAEPTRAALIEPFSGPVAAVGNDALLGFEYAAEDVNKRYGTDIEIVPYDNAMNAEKTTQQVKAAIDDGIGFIIQGTGSNHALNIIQQLKKHNQRNPDNPVIFLNHSAVTTDFTEAPLCSFYHFRFDANVSMKVAALTTAMGMDDKVTKVYLINQNYAFGQAFQKDANEMIPERSPGAEIVGDELIVPFGKIQDFTPYIAKIKASGADTVLTGNWGPDLTRMVTAGIDAGLDVQWYTIYGYLNSTLPVFGKQVIGNLKATFENNINDDGPQWITDIAADYQQKYDGKSWVAHRIYQTVEGLGKAIKEAGSDDPLKVAMALEGIQLEGQYGTVTMRKQDHQMQLPMVVGTVTDSFKLEQDKSGVAFKTDFVVPVEETSLPTTCEMDDRPS